MSTRRDDGFTLLEVLIAMGLMGMVFAVVSAAFVISLDSTTDSTGVVQKSQGAAFTSAYFNKDVQSAQSIASTPVAPCSAPAGELVASMAWDDLGTAQGAHYVLRSATQDGPKWLLRLRCGAAETDTLAKRLTAVTLGTSTSTCPSGTDACLTLTGPVGDPHTIASTRRLP